MTIPYVTRLQADMTSLAGTVDYSVPIGRAPFAAQVTLVEYIPGLSCTHATNVAATARTFTLFNRNADGTGTTVFARGAVTSVAASQTAFGTGLIDNVASSLPLTTGAGLLTVAAGDILDWVSSHSGATGGIDTGGRVVVTLSRL